MRIKRTVEPATEPVSLAEAKSQCRVDTSDDDDFITGLIAAARDYVERVSRRAFITQTWRLNLDEWPCDDEVELPKPPLQSVTSVIYTDSDGTPTTIGSTTGDPAAWVSDTLEVDTDSEPGRLKLAYGKSWPSATLKATNPIQITYVAGYGAAAAVPPWVKQAMKLLIGHWYENREDTIAATIKSIPLGVDSLIYLNRAY